MYISWWVYFLTGISYVLMDWPKQRQICIAEKSSSLIPTYLVIVALVYCIYNCRTLQPTLLYSAAFQCSGVRCVFQSPCATLTYHSKSWRSARRLKITMSTNALNSTTYSSVLSSSSVQWCLLCFSISLRYANLRSGRLFRHIISFWGVENFPTLCKHFCRIIIQ